MRTLMKIVLTISLLLLPFIVGLPPASAATFTVINTNDSGAGSLRQAIVDASSGDTIIFGISLSGQTITLSSSALTINKNLTIDGGNNNITISGGSICQVFTVSSGSSLTLQNLTVAHGKSTLGGGGIYNVDGTLSVINCTFSNNSATNGLGGGIYSNNGLTVTNCTFNNNSATSEGGGIYNAIGTLTVTNCTFSNNSVEEFGGGISNDIGTLTVTNCTFSNNSASNCGGGIVCDGGTLTTTNCTFSGNSAAIFGGCAYLVSAIIDFTNCTFSTNTAPNGGGIWNNSSDVTLANCIVWDNSLGGSSFTVRYSDIQDAGYAGNNNNISVDPLLGTLADYGGPVRTIPLLPGSPAINTGTNSADIPANDARGIARSSPDMGAFESRGFNIAMNSGDNQTAPPDSPFADPLKVSVSSGSGEQVDGGKVTFTAPDSGASASFDVNPAVIASGMASINATANATVGSYTVTASAAGAAPVDFSLTNQVSADLAVMINRIGNLTPGANAAYTITVFNNGPSPASNVCVTDTLPPGMTFVSLSVPAGWFATTPAVGGSGTITGTIGALAPGGSTTFTLTVNVASNTVSGTIFSNTASVTSVTADPDSTNNSAIDTGNVIVPVPAGFKITPATLTLTEGGSAGVFTVCLTSSPAGDVTVPVTSSDTGQMTVNPAGLTFTSADWSNLQTVTVTPVDDALYDGNQLVKAVLDSAMSADPQYNGLDPADVSVTVQDNDSQGSSGEDYSPSPVSSTNGSANVISSLGGKISLGSNITLNIPAYALSGSNSLPVKITKADPSSTLPSGFMMMGSAYEITVDDQQHYEFNKPVTITFTFDPAQVPDGEVPAIYYYESSTSQWVRLDGTVSGNAISVTVNHFTLFGILVKGKTQSEISINLTDIENNWARDAIKKLAGMGAVSCYPDGTFRPDAKITRGEFVTILVKALNLKSTASAPAFSDTVDHFAKDSIAATASLRIVGGYDDNTFKPDDPITREQMAVIAIKALKLANTSGETTFSDNSKISAWAKANVLTAINNNIMKGYPDNTFKPQGNATRAEAVSVILKLAK